MKEASRAKARVEVGGPTEWIKKPQKLNLRFVNNSIIQVTSQNKRIPNVNDKKKQI